MKAAIIGDSFVQHCFGTWIETVAKSLGWEIQLQSGVPGGCQHFAYETFVDLIKTRKPDIVLFAHTEPHRLPNAGRYGINVVNVELPQGQANMPVAVQEAAKQYYQSLYYDRFHKDIHNLMVKDLQDLCKINNIKSVHLQSFDWPVPKHHGLWINGGLHNIASTQGEGWHFDRTLRNHFNPAIHAKLAAWLIPHIRYYLDNDLDFHTATLYREDVV